MKSNNPTKTDFLLLKLKLKLGGIDVSVPACISCCGCRIAKHLASIHLKAIVDTSLVRLVRLCSSVHFEVAFAFLNVRFRYTSHGKCHITCK
ncbi:Protein of unknown function [Gryllus bimaculatus]|nr:Protein of unknown function [Gryllus bimaculatus]